MLNNRHTFLTAACAAALLLVASTASAQQMATSASTNTTAAPTNTGINQRDRHGATTTPTDQPNDMADIRMAAAVRRAIVKDKSLSMKAHNLKLVAASGVVTLRGPVASAAEKARVARIAAAVAGVTQVDNQLDVNH